MSNNDICLPALRDVIKEFGLNAKKSMGQNFLLDMNITDRIVRTAASSDYPVIDFENSTIIEVGPGPGGLTRSILKKNPKKLFVIEKDARCVEALSILKAAYGDKIEVLEEDALKIKVKDLGDAPRYIMANLPYNISTKLLTNWLFELKDIQSMTLMFQKEVASRLTALPNSKQYGRLSVITQWLCEVKLLFDLPPSAFTPPPKVTSSVVLIRPRQNPVGEAEFSKLEKVTEAAFGQRRKMLRSSLKKLGNPIEICEKAGVNPTLRAEQISVAEFCAIARAI
jgi:16S rRNA (adenine1518-N6/adenine1519-N6)-dimethyltransferase